jgi:hypothetical protein
MRSPLLAHAHLVPGNPPKLGHLAQSRPIAKVLWRLVFALSLAAHSPVALEYPGEFGVFSFEHQ